MAEGFARHFHGDKFDFYSAGTQKHGMNQRAIKVMSESGVDISKHFSKTVDELGDIKFDLVVTVCGHANENCPVFFGAPKMIHVGFEDPPKLSQWLIDEEEILGLYRSVRDEISEFCKILVEYL
jgi:arsenate reductase